jgi:hypothetical protein
MPWGGFKITVTEPQTSPIETESPLPQTTEMRVAPGSQLHKNKTSKLKMEDAQKGELPGKCVGYRR